jgi:Protein of unknown function (DUF2510)
VTYSPAAVVVLIVQLVTPDPPPPTNVPPGWYPDPERQGTQRYWDGATWTDQLAPLPAEAPSPPVASRTSSSSPSWAMIVSALGGLGIVIGSVGPWATSALESIAGTESDGKWTVWAGVLALVLVAIRRVVLFNIIIGIGIGLVVIDKISTVNNYSVEAFGHTVHPASVGWGLWLTAVSCAALIVGSWFYYDDVKQYRLEKKVDRELDEEEAAEPESTSGV